MLVWASTPKLITGVCGKTLYGYSLGFPPISIKYQDFIKSKTLFVEAPYTSEYLKSIFPNYNILENIRFTLSELRFQKLDYIVKIAKMLNIKDRLRKKGLIFKIREVLKDL